MRDINAGAVLDRDFEREANRELWAFENVRREVLGSGGEDDDGEPRFSRTPRIRLSYNAKVYLALIWLGVSTGFMLVSIFLAILRGDL